MLAAIYTILAQVEEENEPADLYPHWEELLVGAVAFFILFFFMAKWVLPRLNQVLEARREKIQGDLERAEAVRREAEAELARYREQLANAREEANRIIEEGRRTAEQLRKDLQAGAEREAQQIVARAQEEIRTERDRVFQELKTQVGQIAVELAGRVVAKELDREAHERLIDEYIAEVQRTGNGRG